jgi:hypothetical protein
MSSTISRYGYSRRPMSSCTVLDPLGAQVVCRPGHFSRHGDEDVLRESTSYIFKFYLFFVLLCNYNSLLYA